MTIKIGELAKRTDCPVVTIRFYENEGLLPPPQRGDNNYRLYDETLVERLQFIRHCRALNMSLEDIKNLLNYKDWPQRTCDRVNELLDQHIERVESCIQIQLKLKEQLVFLRGQCSGSRTTDTCGVLRELSQLITNP